MDNQEIKRLNDKLDQLGRRMSQIEARLGLTGHQPPHFGTATSPPPLPFQAPNVTEPVSGYTAEIREEISRERARVHNTEIEYKVGAKFLPYTGALLLVLGILFLVTLAFQQGWITPAVLTWTGVALSSALVYTGQRLRDEREQFGELLTGVGTCGLYVTLSAGHIAHDLYSGATMLLMLTGLSLATIAYGLWRDSKAFWAVGIVGGYLVTHLANQGANQALPVNLALFTPVMLAGGIVAARNRWLWPSVLFLPVSYLALLQSLTNPGLEWAKVVLVYATALVCAYGYCRSFAVSRFDPDRIALPAMLGGAAWIAFEVKDSLPGSAHVLVFGVLLWLLSRIVPETIAKDTLVYIAVTLPLTLAPWGATKVQTGFILPVVAVGLAIYGRRVRSHDYAFAGFVQALLAGTAIIVCHAQHLLPTWALEGQLVAVFIAGLGAVMAIVAPVVKSRELVLGTGCAVLGVAIVRLVLIVADPLMPGLSQTAVWVGSLVIAASVMHTVGSASRTALPRVLALFPSVLAGIGYASYVSEVPPGTERFLMAAVALGHMYLVGRLAWTDGPPWKVWACLPTVGASAVMAGVLRWPLISSPWIDYASTSTAWGFFAASVFVWVPYRLMRQLPLVVFQAAASGIGTVWFILSRLETVSRPETLTGDLLVAALGAASVWGAAKNLAAKAQVDRKLIASCSALFFGTLLSWSLFRTFGSFAGLDTASSRVLAILLMSLAALVATHVHKAPGILATAWAGWLLVAYEIVAGAAHAPWVTALLLVVQIGLAVVPDDYVSAQSAHRWFHIVLLTGFWTKLAADFAGSTSGWLGVDPAITLGWTVLSVAGMVVGFLRKVRPLRQGALVLLVLTAAKLVVVDLAGADPIVRVVTTLALGGAMVGGGFLYVRLKDRLFAGLDGPPTAPGLASHSTRD